MQGYVYSTFLKAYNPQRDVSERPDDFDNLSLFVSGSRSSSLYNFSSSSQQGAPESTEEQLDIAEEQHVRQLVTGLSLRNPSHRARSTLLLHQVEQSH